MSSRILYIDDENDIREVAEMALGLDLTFDVQTCGSGLEGVELARQFSPDLILLDVMMPGLDGPAVLEMLKEDPATAKIPIVFITARTQTQEVAQLRALGARGTIAKPFDPMTLAQQVSNFLRQDIDDRLAKFAALFVAQAHDTAAAIEACIEREAWDELSRLCHSLAGRAGMFGYGQIGEKALSVEAAINAETPPTEFTVLARALIENLKTLES